MKHTIQTLLIAGTLTGAATVQADHSEGRQLEGQSGRQQGFSLNQQRGHGAPNSLRNPRGQQGQGTNRQTLRQPFEQNGNQGRTQQGRGNQGRGNQGQTQQGGHRRPQAGMTRTEPGGNHGGQTQQGGNRGGQQQQGQRGNSLRERLQLTSEQWEALKAAYKKWKTYAKSVHQNQSLSNDEKRAKLREGFKKYNAKVREILTQRQYAQLEQIRRNAARPNNGNNNGQAGHGNNGTSGTSQTQRRQNLIQELGLTEEQVQKFRAIHQYATKKIREILNNRELTRAQKYTKINAVKKQAHNRRMEVLTEEQKLKLREIIARRQTEGNQGTTVSGTSGRPRSGQGQNNGGNFGRQNGGRGQNPQGGRTQNPRGNERQPGNQTTTEQPRQQSDKVILYTARGCSYCNKAEELLKENNVDFIKKDIGADRSAYAELSRKTREAGIQWRGGIPVTDNRGSIIVGYNRTHLSRIE